VNIIIEEKKERINTTKYVAELLFLIKIRKEKKYVSFLTSKIMLNHATHTGYCEGHFLVDIVFFSTAKGEKSRELHLNYN